MPTLVKNKKAYFDYEMLEKFEAGIELRGFEVKSLKKGQGSIAGARVIIRGNEAFIIGMNIPPYQSANTPDGYEPDSTRRLLLTKKEISKLTGVEAQKGLTIIPISVYTKRGLIKVEVSVARGKKKYDKREVIKKRETKRKIDREMKM